jgi:hypothetical protein
LDVFVLSRNATVRRESRSKIRRKIRIKSKSKRKRRSGGGRRCREPQGGAGLALEAGETATVTGPGERGRMNAAGPATHGDEPPKATMPPRQTGNRLGRITLQLPAQDGRSF